MRRDQLEAKLVELLGQDTPSVDGVSEVLGIGLVEQDATPGWVRYVPDRELDAEASDDGASDDWASVELRILRKKKGGLLVLSPRRPSPWTAADVRALTAPPFDGPPSAFDTLPRVPPEGVNLVTYERGQAEVSFEQDVATGELTAVIVKWR